MRLVIATGSLLILAGGAALYILRNGFFMYLVGHLTYAPPNTADGVEAGFSALAAERSETPGVTLGALANARIICLGDTGPAAAEEAFRRINLVLLGAGADSFSPVISPDARRIPELRPDLARSDGRRPETHAPRNAAKVKSVLDSLADPAAPIQRGLDLSGNFATTELRRMVTAMAADGEGFQSCMANARY